MKSASHGTLAAAVLLLMASSARAAAPDAVITNTGSTNMAGYRVTVQPTGLVTYVVTQRGAVSTSAAQSGRVPATLARRFFHDLAAAGSLSRLPVGHGMKSASFGTSMFVECQGERTPDLSFPANPKAQAIHDDAMAIVAALHLSTLPRFLGGPMRPK